MAATEILYRLSGSREDVLETDQPENKNGIWQPYLILYKTCSFCPDTLTNMAAIGNSCFWLVSYIKSSTLKTLGQRRCFRN
jgi:hypothetical protein